MVGRSEARQSAATSQEEGGEEIKDEDKEEEGEVVAVLVVWERVRDPEAEAEAEEKNVPALPYAASDELILRTLASITGRLLLQDEEMTQLKRAYGEVEQRNEL